MSVRSARRTFLARKSRESTRGRTPVRPARRPQRDCSSRIAPATIRASSLRCTYRSLEIESLSFAISPRIGTARRRSRGSASVAAVADRFSRRRRAGLRDVAVVGMGVSDLLLRLPRGTSYQATAARLALHLLGNGDDAGALSRHHLLRIAARTRAAGPTAGTAGPSVS